MIAKVLRKEARENLKGKWKRALLIMLLFFILNIILTFFTYWISINTSYGTFASILNIVVVVPLSYGLLTCFIRLKRNEKANCIYLIYDAYKYGNKVWKNIGRVIWKLLAYLLIWGLSLYLMITEFVSLYYGNGMRISYVIEILSVIAFSVIICMKILYYSLNNNILYDNKRYKTKEVLKESERLMKNHRWDLIKLNLSFAGWFLLGVIFSISIILFLYFIVNVQSVYLTYITCIPIIFLLPYIQIANICFYDNLLYNNPKSKERTKNKRNKMK